MGYFNNFDNELLKNTKIISKKIIDKNRTKKL
jgi:hypothetical protein